MAREKRQKRDDRFGIYSPKRFIIASEGEETEIKYFTALKEKMPKRFFNNVNLIVCTRDIENKNNSSPEHVLACAEEYINKILPRVNVDTDEVYIVVDKDRWPNEMLASVRRLCNQKKFNLLVSNPCFEVWLLLHYIDLATCSEDEVNDYLGINRHPRKNKVHPIKKALSRIVDGYTCSSFDIEKFYNLTNLAISNAEKIEIPHDWPNSIGTRVHVLVKKIPPFSENYSSMK